ncbi:MULTISPECIES: acyl-CoA thioesterase II [Actinokineospora]|uniref:Acyl-CoA thioesterase 2 n=1 Tax=Actinokineospora fastidiosa TaxID=1816 RepID=A0A918GIM2_9PSEU|nr:MULTISPECIES: acyl-CoA thioesterase II [Actinokineospora]UVS80859.1 Acyl-CoA thioesterase 2 [Actinokineospora sp. UTMC 2448]GGS37728.1 acyl-CoA thioesterase II [Actinokineospora fastidiosa]
MTDVAEPTVLDRLVRLLDLERVEEDIFRGVSPKHSPVRVFGGQVAGQALVAAGRTVPADRPVHSLHAYFIRGGDPAVPIVYQVDRIRDGRSFTTRRVVAVQHGKPIFSLSASFQLVESGVEHAEEMPVVPDPETLPTYSELMSPQLREKFGPWAQRPRPIDVRYVSEPAWRSRETGPRDARNQVWMRADGVLPDDPLTHVCVLAYASDMTLLDAVLARHGVYWGVDNVLGASLDHAMWFHRPFRADEWVLYDCASPSASGGRGLATGRFFSRDGRLIATVVQEGMLRVID